MAKVSPIINSFNAGEFSPLMHARSDINFYNNACRRTRNFIPTPQGPARRRSGTRHVAEIKNSAHRSWLGKFEFNDEQAYTLEFGNLYIRFFSNHGVVGAPLEVVTPYTIADLTGADETFSLRSVQTGDLLYIVHRSYAPRILARTAAAAFNMSVFANKGGPFKELNDTATAVHASASTGNIELVSTVANVFLAGHVGTNFLLEQNSTDDILQWEPGVAIVANGVRRSDGKNYKAVNTATTGTIRPTHSVGAKYDGNTGVQWTFLDAGFGWATINSIKATSVKTITGAVNNGAGLIRVTAVAHGFTTGYTIVVAGVTGTTEANGTWIVTVVTADTFDLQGSTFANAYVSGGTATLGAEMVALATVVSRIPDEAVGSANRSTAWAHSAWSDAEGWPDAVTFFRNRLCFTRDRTVWMSETDNFEFFRDRDENGQVVSDSAFTGTLNSDKSNLIKWVAPSDRALLVGTAGDEHAVMEITDSDPFGPGNGKADKQTEYGSRHVPVARIGDGVLFVQIAGRKVRDMRQAESVNERWDASDQTILAEHVTKSGVIDMAYQQEPDSVLWTVLSNGKLVGFTMNREQEVRGWHPHRIGGVSDSAGLEFAKVESVVSIPSPDGKRDELWMIVKRWVNGAVKRYVEWMEVEFETGDDQEDAFYVDSGLTLNNTVAATLTPGANATVKGTTGVTFTAGSAVFVSGDVGRYIHYRYSTINVKGETVWNKSIAKITGFTSTTVVTATIILPWPSLSVIASAGWRLTATVISGLPHLEGQVVQVCADGGSHPDRTVSGGSITLANPASKVHVGLGCPAILQPMPIEAGAADGASQTKTKRASRVGIRFLNTLGCKYGRDEDLQLDVIPTHSGEQTMGLPPPLFTGDKVVSWPDGYQSELLITMVQDQPLPCTVIGLFPQMKTEDNR